MPLIPVKLGGASGASGSNSANPPQRQQPTPTSTHTFSGGNGQASLFGLSALALQPITELIYCVRHRTSGLYFGREPKYDTIFELGYDANVSDDKLLERWSDLLKYDRAGVMNLLRADLKDKSWVQIGGDPNLVQVVEFTVSLDPLCYAPADLLAELLIEDAYNDDKDDDDGC